MTPESLAAATGRSVASIRSCLHDIRARAFAERGVFVSEGQALEALGQVLAMADVAAEMPALAHNRPTKAPAAVQGTRATVDPLDVIRGR